MKSGEGLFRVLRRPTAAGTANRAARLMVLALLAVGLAPPLSARSAEEILEQAEGALYPDNFYMEVEMNTHKPSRRDSMMVFESYHREGAGTFMEVIAPARSRGMRFLQKEEDLWMYNPRSNSRRAIRLSPRDSFQGSAFSNNDVGDPDYSDDYEVRVAGRETVNHEELGSVQTVRLELTAKRQSTTYGRIVMWIRESDDIPLKMEYYAKSGLLFKRMTLSEISELAGRQRPSFMRMDSLEQDGFYSTLEIRELESRDDLPDRYFSQANLTR
ncbi:MAG: outer membrane lipoprotein-sorting protein [Alkalispirochaetaceae bacterium]